MEIIMAKKATVSVIAPHNTVEANTSLYRIGLIDRQVDSIEAALAAEVARLRREADQQTADLIAERAGRIAGLESFATANRDVILVGDKKSLELSAGVIGWRFTPTKVVLAKGGEEKALETLHGLKLRKYIRVQESVNREALLEDRPVIKGIKYQQTEKFFVEAKTVTDPEASTNVVALSVAA